MTIRKLEYAWKFRKALWKYRHLLKHRHKIALAAGVAIGIASVMLVRGSRRGSTRTPPNA